MSVFAGQSVPNEGGLTWSTVMPCSARDHVMITLASPKP